MNWVAMVACIGVGIYVESKISKFVLAIMVLLNLICILGLVK